MKRTYKFFWIILIALIPLLPSSGWNFSIDVSDVGFNMNQYRFCFTDMDSTYLPLFLTNILGGCLLKVFGILHIPAYIGMETASLLFRTDESGNPLPPTSLVRGV